MHWNVVLRELTEISLADPRSPLGVGALRFGDRFMFLNFTWQKHSSRIFLSHSNIACVFLDRRKKCFFFLFLFWICLVSWSTVLCLSLLARFGFDFKFLLWWSCFLSSFSCLDFVIRYEMGSNLLCLWTWRLKHFPSTAGGIHLLLERFLYYTSTNCWKSSLFFCSWQCPNVCPWPLWHQCSFVCNI